MFWKAGIVNARAHNANPLTNSGSGTGIHLVIVKPRQAFC